MPLARFGNSQQILGDVIACSDAGYFISDRPSGFTFRTARYNELLGLPAVETEGESGAMRDRVHPDDQALVEKPLAEFMAGARDSLELDLRARTVEGGWAWRHLRARTVERDGDGRPVRIVGFLTDIDRVKAADEALHASEAALRETERRLNMVLDNARDGINMLDLKTGRYVFMSPAQVALTGFSRDEILGMSAAEAYDRCHPDDRHVSVEQQAALAAGSSDLGTVEYRWKVKSGEYRWFSDSRKVVRDDSGEAVALVGVSRDITDLKRATEALRESENRLRVVMEASSDGYWDRDLVTGRVFHSARMNEMVGLPAEETEVDSHEWRSRIHPEDMSRLAPYYAAALEGDAERVDAEYRLRCAGGSWKWVRARGKVVQWDASGRAVRMAGTVTDIDAQKMAEMALAESEERYRLLVERLPDGMFVVQDGRVAFANMAAARVTGYASPEEFMGSDPAARLSPEDLAKVGVNTRRVLEGETVEPFDITVLRPDGSRRVVETYGGPVSLGGRPAVQIVMRDVEDQRAAARALAESERRFRTLAEASPVGIFRADASGRNEYLNSAGANMLGRPAAMAHGEGWYTAIHPDDRARVLREWSEALGSGGLYSGELRFVKPSGEVVDARVYGDALRDAEGAVTGTTGVMIDVTRERQAEERLAAASRLAAMGTLVAGVGHEINNPLAAMVAGEGFVLDIVRDLIARLRSAEPPPAGRVAAELDETVEPLMDGLASGQRIAQIVKDLALFAAADRSREPLRLRSVVDAGLRWLPASIGSAAQVTVEDRGAPGVVGRAGQLSQVVLNLVSNAFRASGDRRPPKVTVRLRTAESGAAILEVEDDGEGMTEEVRSRVFDPFFTTRPAGDTRGVGLGLAICQSIVSAHGGTVSVESEPGKGSKFTVELPAAGEPVPPRTAPGGEKTSST